MRPDYYIAVTRFLHRLAVPEPRAANSADSEFCVHILLHFTVSMLFSQFGVHLRVNCSSVVWTRSVSKAHALSLTSVRGFTSVLPDPKYAISGRSQTVSILC